jgi:hypothetical protein
MNMTSSAADPIVSGVESISQKSGPKITPVE